MWQKRNAHSRREVEPLTKNGFRKDHRRPEAFFANNRPSEHHRERKDSEGASVISSSPRVYVPVQFENSLGKLQVCFSLHTIDLLLNKISGPMLKKCDSDNSESNLGDFGSSADLCKWPLRLVQVGPKI